MFGFQQYSSCQHAVGQHMQYLDRQDIRCYAAWGSKMGVSFLNQFHFTGKGCTVPYTMHYQVTVQAVRTCHGSRRGGEEMAGRWTCPAST